MGRPKKDAGGTSKSSASRRGQASAGMRKSNRGKSPSAAQHVQVASKGSAQVCESHANLPWILLLINDHVRD